MMICFFLCSVNNCETLPCLDDGAENCECASCRANKRRSYNTSISLHLRDITLTAVSLTLWNVIYVALWARLLPIPGNLFVENSFKVDIYGNVLMYGAMTKAWQSNVNNLEMCSPLAGNIDHKVAHSRGGLTTMSNLVLVAWWANVLKGSSLLEVCCLLQHLLCSYIDYRSHF